MEIDIEEIRKKKPINELVNFSILNIDKPSGPTSFGVDCTIKELLNLKKVSHFGTLDPKVTGVLPVALNRACRLSDYFMHKNKKYVGIMRVHSDVSAETLKEKVKQFIGKIKQTPPRRSSVKRQERERQVFSFNILEIEGRKVLFETEVQAGTYIRKLVDDIGKNIGGAHMLELRRIKAGIFSENEKEFVDMYEFKKAVQVWKENNKEDGLRKILIPAEIIYQLCKPVQIKEESIGKLMTGKPIYTHDIKEGLDCEEELFSAFFENKLIGIYRIVNKREFLARPEFVFSELKN